MPPVEEREHPSFVLAALVVFVILTIHWEPLGPEPGMFGNLVFVGTLVGGFLLFFSLFRLAYPYVLWLFLHLKIILLWNLDMI